MKFPERFSALPEYAFPRLRRLLDKHTPGARPIRMTIGEPQHPMPDFVGPVLAEHTGAFGVYPPNEGTPELLEAIRAWLSRRYQVDIESDRLMALNGTREGLFNAALALAPESKNGKKPVILMPNPFYQVYAVAALATGAEPIYVPATAETGFLPDYTALSPQVLERVGIAYLCSPANPQGAIASAEYLAAVLDLAERYDFLLFVDECYSEIWRDAPPTGILEVLRDKAADPERVVAFHSLSKRSNLPGLRSGFVVAGPQSMVKIRQLRAFSGAPLPLPLQRVAEAAWRDDTHVAQSLALYHQKFALADALFSGTSLAQESADPQGRVSPQGGFFLWLKVPGGDGEAAALKLWQEVGVQALPGAYLARDVGGRNPGKAYIRVALVAPQDETRHGLTLLRECLYNNTASTIVTRVDSP